MKNRGTQLGKLLAGEEPVVAPGGFDPLSFRIIESLGFPAAYLGGWATGAHLCTTEPLLTLTEQVTSAALAVKATNIPLIVDGDAGYGEPVHTMRAVREYEMAGIAAIHIEDQIFPKRASYHRNVLHIIPLEEMMEKIKAALGARQNNDFLIIARTDARGAKGGSLAETLRRVAAFAEAGVDMIMPTKVREPFVPKEQVPKEAEAIAQAAAGVPLVWVEVFSGLSVNEIAQLGYKVIIYPMLGTSAIARAFIETYGELKKTGMVKTGIEKLAEVRLKVEEIIGLPQYYAVEDRTTEKG